MFCMRGAQQASESSNLFLFETAFTGEEQGGRLRSAGRLYQSAGVAA
jgi:hypothetical protein